MLAPVIDAEVADTSTRYLRRSSCVGTFIHIVPLSVTVVTGDLAQVLAGTAVASSAGRAGCIDAGGCSPGVSAPLLVLVALIIPFPLRSLVGATIPRARRLIRGLEPPQ